jgi:hypothetical protein
MTVNNNRKYEELYTELLGRGEMLHQSNKKRIRRGIIILIILPFVLEFIRWMTDSDKVVFLIIWIIIMFVLSAYLISIEYLDYTIEETLRDVTDTEADFGELLPRPELRRGDLHERIRERFTELREQRLAAPDPAVDESEAHSEAETTVRPDEGMEIEDAVEQLEEVREAEAAMEELQETVPAEIIAAMKEAFDADIHRKEAAQTNREEELSDTDAAADGGEEDAE